MGKNKATLAKVKPRFKIVPNKSEGILEYDRDNAYPQRNELITKSSGVASGCIRLYAKYLMGQGFLDKDFYRFILNADGLTVDKMLRSHCDDKANTGGWAVHVNYNANFEIDSFNLIAISDLRLAIPDDSGLTNKIVHYDDWYLQKRDRIDRKKFTHYDTFNPDPEAIKSQVLAAGGWANWKGQVHYWTPKGLQYPTPIFAPVIEDILTDASLKTFRLNNVDTSFLAQNIFVHKGEFEDDTEREQFVESLESFQGADNAGKMMLVEVEDENQIPTLLPVETPKNDKVFELTDRTAKESIVEAFGQPPVLNARFLGGAFSQQEYADAKLFYDEYTADERNSFSEEYKRLFSYFKEKNVNPSNDWTIIPMTGLKVESEKAPLIATIGVGGAQAIQNVLADPNMKEAQKVGYLCEVMGMEEAGANRLVYGSEIKPTEPTVPDPTITP